MHVRGVEIPSVFRCIHVYSLLSVLCSALFLPVAFLFMFLIVLTSVSSHVLVSYVSILWRVGALHPVLLVSDFFFGTNKICSIYFYIVFVISLCARSFFCDVLFVCVCVFCFSFCLSVLNHIFYFYE